MCTQSRNLKKLSISKLQSLFDNSIGYGFHVFFIDFCVCLILFRLEMWLRLNILNITTS